MKFAQEVEQDRFR